VTVLLKKQATNDTRRTVQNQFLFQERRVIGRILDTILLKSPVRSGGNGLPPSKACGKGPFLNMEGANPLAPWDFFSRIESGMRPARLPCGPFLSLPHRDAQKTDPDLPLYIRPRIA